MSWITVAWSMMASAILTLALLHLFIWFNQTRQWAHLAFSIAAIAVAVIAGMEFMGMRAASIEQMAALLRWAHLPFLVIWVALACFVRFHFDAGRLWLAWTVCGLRTLALILRGVDLFVTVNIIIRLFFSKWNYILWQFNFFDIRLCQNIPTVIK